MYAIIKIAGLQYIVSPNKFLYVPKLKEKEGEIIYFKNLFFLNEGNENITLGTKIIPIEGCEVNAKIISHIKGKKITIFKKKRRKGFRLRRGHRQFLSKILILSIKKNKYGS